MHRSIYVVTVAALFVGVLPTTSACGSAASLIASDDLRTPIARDGGNEITIPALWADDRAGTSGTEPARIWATKDGSALFTIDLSGIEAEGAGAQWTAASAAAAAVGSMVSGINPGRVDVDFDVSGPIDGPSAGGILTVGVIAALLGAPIRGDMTMTGTISPDGSIGPVGGIDLKLKAAADQGYRTVLLPIANMNVRNRETNETESAVDLGKTLNLEVIPVGNVQEAFTLFTDGKFAYPAAPAFVLPAAVQNLAQRQAASLLATVTDRLTTLPPGNVSAQIAELLQLAQDAAAKGDSATAYGVGMQALNMVNRELASVDAQGNLNSLGLVGASKWLQDWATAAKSRNDAKLDESTRLATGLGYEQQLTLPNALSWLTYNDAILKSLQQRMDSGSLDAGKIDRFARILADVDAAIDVYCPNQLAIIDIAPSVPSPGESAVATYLSEYTTFLIRAGQAQQDYVQQVVMRGQDPIEIAKQNDLGMLLPAVLNLREAVDGIAPTTDSLADEVRQATTAVTYYIATTSLIAAVQDFGIDQFGIGADPAQVQQPDVMQATVVTAQRAVAEISALLGQRGLDASLPVWASDYGASAVEAMVDTPQLAAAEVLALNELYFDAITVFMLQSGPVK